MCCQIHHSLLSTGGVLLIAISAGSISLHCVFFFPNANAWERLCAFTAPVLVLMIRSSYISAIEFFVYFAILFLIARWKCYVCVCVVHIASCINTYTFLWKWIPNLALFGMWATYTYTAALTEIIADQLLLSHYVAIHLYLAFFNYMLFIISSASVFFLIF